MRHKLLGITLCKKPGLKNRLLSKKIEIEQNLADFLTNIRNSFIIKYIIIS